MLDRRRENWSDSLQFPISGCKSMSPSLCLCLFLPHPSPLSITMSSLPLCLCNKVMERQTKSKEEGLLSLVPTHVPIWSWSFHLGS